MLSKSKYIKGLQCEKRLWLDTHQRNLKDEISSEQEALFSQGSRVGELAQQLFPGGIDASLGVDLKSNFSQWITNTKQLIISGQTIIYEAAFNPAGAFAAMDILIRENDAWRAIEVKSSTTVKDYTIDDAAVQYFILSQAGLNLIDIEIMHINNEYTRHDKLDLNNLFKRESVLDKVLAKQNEIPQKMNQFIGVLKSSQEPQREIGPHCDDPFTCDFKGHCWKHIPEESIFSIGKMRGKEWDLHEKGIYALDDIPSDYELSEKQRLHLDVRESAKEIFDHDALKNFFSEWEFPLYFFDFETVGPAVPLFDDSRPYRHFPFQYSLHILEKPDSEFIHKEFLPDPSGDPRKDLTEQLIKDLGEKGSIVTWNKGFERGKIAGLMDLFPEKEDVLGEINERIVDLMTPFSKRWMYKAEMNNSASIKNVLPSYIPELTYKDLNIRNGGDASEIYKSMLEGTFQGDKEQTMKDLKSYCELDTLAMVRIYELIIQKLEQNESIK